jgi:RimJ/RimL family protein N-acetyltransferase
MALSTLEHDRDITVHSSLQMRAGRLAVRDAIPEDGDAYVKYWHESGDRIIKFLRIDRARLGSPADSRERFLRMIRVPGAEQKSVIFTMTLNEEAIGYTNLNRHSLDDNYPHFHTYLHTHRPSVRSALRSAEQSSRRGAGVAAVLVGPIMRMCFDLYPLRRIVLQTRPTSVGINRALDFYMPPAVTEYIEKADGLAGPGEFHMRYVYREDAGWMFERAQALARGE